MTASGSNGGAETQMAPHTDRKRRWPPLVSKLVGFILILTGLGFAIPGVQLATLGGSFYYLLCGVALVAAGLFFWKGSATGTWIFAATAAGTLAWALWEVGLNGWALFPRLGIFVLLGALVTLAHRLRRPRARSIGMQSGRRRWAVIATLGILSVAVAAYALSDREGPLEIADGPAPSLAASIWPFTNGSSRSDRYSALEQITPVNVAHLQVAWKTRLGMPPAGVVGAIQATPLMINDTLYTCNVINQVIALDIETGAIKWRFDPKLDLSTVAMGVCRGVAYYKVPDATGPCAERIISFSRDARMFAVDAGSGQRCAGFGRNGEVDMTQAMGAVKKGYYYLTSGPVIVRGKVIVGGSVLDGQSTLEPSGVIRGFDAVTGKFAWAWDMGRPDDHGLPPPGKTFTLGTPNAWAPLTGDSDLGMVYVPLGNATPDYVAAHRSDVMNKYTSSVVAIDVDTGSLRWHYQTTHRDVWDYDIASPATLIDLPTSKGMRQALIQPTKRGVFFVLDRRTGEPLVKTVEVPVPQNPVPGEKLSPTQPYPVGMPSFGGEKLTEAHMWGISPFDQLWCRIKFRQARYDGDFTPIGMKPTIVYPGYLGGSEWAGVAVDPERKLMALNVNHFAMYNQMITREEARKDNVKSYLAGSVPINLKAWPQEGTPYATRTGGFLSPLDTPCIQPPYGEVAVVDLKTRKTVWRQPLGTGRDTGPLGIPSMLPLRMGVPALGGPLVTRSGLMFIAATQERTFRAFDMRNGNLLWQDRLPAGGHSGPMSYYSKRSGRQFIIIPASGHPQMKNGQSDYLMAYALPKKK